MVPTNAKNFLLAVIVTTACYSAPLGADDTIAADNPDDTSISALGDADKGKRTFNRCRSCHAISDNMKHRIGPNLYGIFGREAGSTDKFRYSKALSEASFIWTESKINQWLTKPSAYLPGNKMQFAGVKKEQDRKNLIAYLRTVTVEQD
ncbi:MAG: cytochrome c family protein [Kordiimonadaceae bacterium]|nr:cytochrome c family protein [Kordiimonadaceae bacterium]